MNRAGVDQENGGQSTEASIRGGDGRGDADARRQGVEDEHGWTLTDSGRGTTWEQGWDETYCAVRFEG